MGQGCTWGGATSRQSERAMTRADSSCSCSRLVIGGALATFLAGGLASCTPQPTGSSLEEDPSAIKGEFVTYVADFEDGHSETWHALRPANGPEIRLDFDTPPNIATGLQVRVRGELTGQHLRVNAMELVPGLESRSSALDSPDLVAAPAMDTYGLVLVDLGSGVNVTAAQGMTTLNSTNPADKSFASYYGESSYGKYTVSGTILGPFPFTMTTCDTSGMATAIEAMITGTVPNHLIYYFNRSSLCTFGGLGEEGSSARPAKRTWMNGSLSCVVLMQEPGHNLGLMHANTMKCTDSFSTAPSGCTITEY